MAFYYLAFAFVLSSCVVPLIFPWPWRKVIALFLLSAIFVVLVTIAGLRAETVDPDYHTYLDWYSEVNAGGLGPADFVKDPSFVGISYVFSSFGGPYSLVAMVFSILAISMKWVVGKFSYSLRLFPLFVYLEFCRFFLVQDMTAIRAAVAIPIMTLSVLAALRRKRWIALLLFAVAATFHVSVAIAIPALYVAMAHKIKSRWFLLYMGATAAVLYFLLKGILLYLGNVARVADYLNGTYEVSTLRLLSVFLLFRVSIESLIVIRLWKRISDEDKFIVFCSTMGLAFQMVLSSNDALALRSSEVFGIFDVLMFLIPLKVVRRPTQFVYAGLLILAGLVFFNSSVKIMQPYKTVISYFNNAIMSPSRLPSRCEVASGKPFHKM